MNFKKGFTIFELLVVVSIISLLIYISSGWFSYKDIDRIRFDTCYMHSVAELNSFFQSAILQKMIYTGGKYRSINSYNIIFDTTGQKLILDYSGAGYKQEIRYNGSGFDNKNSCYSPTYYTKISGDKIQMDIAPGLQSENFPITFKKNGSTINKIYQASGTIYFLKCSRNNKCEQRYKLEFIPKAYLIKSYFCKSLNSAGHCTSWSE